MSTTNGTHRRSCSSCFSDICSRGSEVQEIDRPFDGVELQSFHPLRSVSNAVEASSSSAKAPEQSPFPTSTKGALPNIAIPSMASQSSSRRQHTTTPPPRTRQGTAPTTRRSSKMPSSKRASWGSANPTSPTLGTAGVKPVEGLSVSPEPSYHGTDSRNSSLRSLRQKPPPTFVDHRDSLVLDSIQQRSSRTQRSPTMQGVKAGGLGSISPAQSTTSVSSGGFGDYLVNDAPFIEPPTPLPSMSKDRPPVRPQASTSSELLQGLGTNPSPPQTATRRFAGPSNPHRLPSQRIARRESEVFPEGQQPIFSPE